MTRLRNCVFCTLVFLIALLGTEAHAATSSTYVLLVRVHDTLQPVRARSFASDMAEASKNGIHGVVIQISTPGGMESATDIMVNAIRRCPVPVIAWVDSPLSRVSGQGLRLIAEADVVVMAPETYLTPLWTQLPRNVTAQARAEASQRLLQNLTQAAARHERSTAAFQELTYGVHWFAPAEARRAGLIDGTALNITELTDFLQDGRIIMHRGKPFSMNEGVLVYVQRSISSKDLLLLTMMNPNLDVLLLTLGLLLIYLEINTPGIVVPGAFGLLLVLLSCFSIGSLPLSTSGIALCLGGLFLLILESRLQSSGVVALLGVLVLTRGLGTIVAGPIPQLQVGWPTAIGAGIGFGGITATLVSLAAMAKREKIKTGADAVLGWLAVAQTPLAPTGKVLVRGELWDARLTTHDSSVAEGGHVKVLGADGMTLEVTAIPLTQSS